MISHYYFAFPYNKEILAYAITFLSFAFFTYFSLLTIVRQQRNSYFQTATKAPGGKSGI